MYMQKGKNELKDCLKESGMKIIEGLEETAQKRVMGVLVQRQSEALDVLDCVTASVRPPCDGRSGKKKFTPDQILLSPVLTILFGLGSVVFTFICALSGRPDPAAGTEPAALNLRWLFVLLFSLLILGQAVYRLVGKAKSEGSASALPAAEVTLDAGAAKLKLEKQLSRLMNDSAAICGMFRNQALEGANTYEDELVRLYAALYEAKVDRPDCGEFSYSLTLAEMMLRQIGLKTVPYSDEQKNLFHVETEDYHDEMRFPAVVRMKTGELVKKGEYIRNRAQLPA